MRTTLFPAIILGWLLVSGCSQPRSQTKDDAEDQCVRNMEIVWGTAECYSLEVHKGGDAIISHEELTPYFKEGRSPCCPMGTNAYPSFVLSRGPSCPNSPAHTTALLAKVCANDRAFVWDVAISYCREHHLSWDTKIDVNTIGFPLTGEAAATVEKFGCLSEFKCPTGTNDYPPFILREGPHCLNDEAHNKIKVIPRVNAKYFDANSNVITTMQW